MYATRQAYVAYGVDASDQEIAHHFGDWKAARFFGIKDVDGCRAVMTKIANEKLKEVQLYPGAKDLLETLSVSKKLALLSSSARDVLELGLEHNGIKEMFNVVISGDDVTKHKPHPEVIEKGMKAINANKAETVMIGDSRKDIGAAKNAGIDSVLLYPQTHQTFYNLQELMTYGPTYVVSGFDELNQLINPKTKQLG